MYEIIAPLPGDRFRTIKLKNNKIQQQIIDLIEANY